PALAGLRQAQAGADVRTPTEEVAFRDRNVTEPALLGRIAHGRAIVAGRVLVDDDADEHLVGSTAGLQVDAHLLEEAERLDGGLGARDHRTVEGVAFGEAQLAPD